MQFLRRIDPQNTDMKTNLARVVVNGAIELIAEVLGWEWQTKNAMTNLPSARLAIAGM